ncbi:MAG: 5'/3'-nucleotidase SurE [Myxococcales bacterium]|nr:5'/3'-nucleotidase SurE [Myxococcales bacterium]
MKRLLVSNDDGIDSPALPPLLRALAALGEVRCVVPDGQRSWIGASVSRFATVRVSPVELDGRLVHACSGTPADCVNLGIHSLYDDAPDLVVSGINLGLNHGDAFITSSGTIGAAAEAVASGLPAVAASLGLARPVESATGPLGEVVRGARWDDAAAIVADVVRAVLDHGLPDDVDLVSVNVPEGATCDTPRCLTTVARTAYDRLFHPVPGAPSSFRAEFGGLRERAPSDAQPHPSDHAVLKEGIVSITPLRLAQGVALAPTWEAFGAALEQRRR